MNDTFRRTGATASRVLRQLGHDRRSVGLLIVVPAILLALFKYVYSGADVVFERIGPQLLGIFPFIIMFLITSVTMVRERTSGTLERLLTTLLRRGELIAGYALAFGLAAAIQSAVTVTVSLGLLELSVRSVWVVVVFAVLDAVLGTALGLLFSAFATTEFQAVQFMPAVVLPQLLLCGLLNPRQNMATALRWLSDVLPLTYATDAFTRAGTQVGLNGPMWRDLVVLLGCLAVALGLASLTLRRRTA
ncbi:ABC transporter permease [Jatrophihabitans telluris]|uniref:Transport permease protein n=1 Tax=Jatrophihabitans telluris TaxID=2038343 RepID=A0ABY4QY24_9ACTN|nr:ABC transporter permease [Jatrophihabitans telluris]UQX87751.1 ABC transporter permease [Jatrophihabitans telluris]